MRSLIAVACVALVLLVVLWCVGCGCSAHESTRAENPAPDLKAISEKVAPAAKDIQEQSSILYDMIAMAWQSAKTAGLDLGRFLARAPDPKPAEVVDAQKQLDTVVVPKLEAARATGERLKTDAAQIKAAVDQLPTLARKIDAVAADRDAGWKEAQTQQERADSGARQDLIWIIIFGVAALGGGFAVAIKLSKWAGGGLMVLGASAIVGGAAGIWILDHWWQVSLALVGCAGLAALAWMASKGYLGAKAQVQTQVAVDALKTGHVDNATWLQDLEAKVVAIEGRLAGGPAAEPPPAQPPVAGSPPAA